MSQGQTDILHPSTSVDLVEWPPLPVKICNAQSVWLNETLLVGGGFVSLRRPAPDMRAAARLYMLRHEAHGTWNVTDTPTYWYALAVHDSELLLVGGCEYYAHKVHKVTSKVFTMHFKGKKFHESLPPMKEARYAPSVVSNGCALVVAGGLDKPGHNMSSVEVLKNSQWICVSSLPSAGGWMKSVLHGDGDRWYVFQAYESAFCVSLKLLVSGQGVSRTDSPWRRLPDPFYCNSSAAFFGERLLTIGGEDELETTTAICAFSTNSESWEYVADLPVPVSSSSTILMPTGELLVIGGKNKEGKYTEKIIKAHLVDNDARLSLPKLHALHNYGVRLMDALYEDCYRFHVISGVQILMKDRVKVSTLPPQEYISLVLEAWQKSRRPTYPFTWVGLFSVLRKMDLGHHIDGIAKYVAGSVTEIEGLPESYHLDSSGDSEQEGESSVFELKAAVKCLLKDKQYLEDELDQYDKCRDQEIINQLERKVERLKDEIIFLKAKNKDLSPVKPDVKIETNVSSPHVPVEVERLSEAQNATHNLTLPGVDVVASTNVVLTNLRTTFNWSGYGFKLTVPPDSLPAGVDSCRLDIVASIAGQYQFPDALHPISTVYWVRSSVPGPFERPLTVELQHCAKQPCSTKLSFLRAHCSQESLPYIFKKVDKGGSFSESSSYALLEVTNFSGLTVAGDDDVERRYTASLYHLNGTEPYQREMHFVVNWDDEIHKTLESNEYVSKNAICKINHFIEFEKDRVTLDIPMRGKVKGGWKITPMFPPTVSDSKVVKKHVDDFKGPGQRIPHCHLKVEMLDRRKKSKLFHQVKLFGAKDPFNIITIDLDPQQALQVPDVTGPSSISSVQESDQILGGKKPDLNKVYLAVFNAAVKWYNLGLFLEIDRKTLNNIEANNSDNTICLRKMLDHWLDSSSSCTWSNVRDGLRSPTVELNNLADVIEDIYCNNGELSQPSIGKKRKVSPEPTDQEAEVPSSKRSHLS